MEIIINRGHICRFFLYLLVAVLVTGCSSILTLKLSSDTENTKFIVDGREVGSGQWVTASIEHGVDIPHKLIARRDGYCELKDDISPPYSKPTPVSFNFSEGGECTPCPEPCKPEYGKYYALVIGNNDYRHVNKLETARNDAHEIADVLKSHYGFTVTLLEDATKSEILAALNNYKDGNGGNPPKLTETDNLLIYYAGHGQVVGTDEADNQGYWLPVDAERDDRKNWIANSYIVSELKSIKSRHILVVADSCYSGMMTRRDIVPEYRGLDQYGSGTKNYRDRFWRLFSKRSRTALTSGGVEPVVDAGGKGNHSVFATILLNALNNSTGIFDSTALFVKIRNSVINKADQTPEYGAIHRAGHDGGDFLFVKQ